MEIITVVSVPAKKITKDTAHIYHVYTESEEQNILYSGNTNQPHPLLAEWTKEEPMPEYTNPTYPTYPTSYQRNEWLRTVAGVS